MYDLVKEKEGGSWERAVNKQATGLDILQFYLIRTSHRLGFSY